MAQGEHSRDRKFEVEDTVPPPPRHVHELPAASDSGHEWYRRRDRRLGFRVGGFRFWVLGVGCRVKGCTAQGAKKRVKTKEGATG